MKSTYTRIFVFYAAFSVKNLEVNFSSYIPFSWLNYCNFLPAISHLPRLVSCPSWRWRLGIALVPTNKGALKMLFHEIVEIVLQPSNNRPFYLHYTTCVSLRPNSHYWTSRVSLWIVKSKAKLQIKCIGICLSCVFCDITRKMIAGWTSPSPFPLNIAYFNFKNIGMHKSHTMPPTIKILYYTKWIYIVKL